jgi:hypothetical protein
MLDARTMAPGMASTEERRISMGDLIAAIYDLAMAQLHDPELAMVATDATLNDILARSSGGDGGLETTYVVPAAE